MIIGDIFGTTNNLGLMPACIPIHIDMLQYILLLLFANPHLKNIPKKISWYVCYRNRKYRYTCLWFTECNTSMWLNHWGRETHICVSKLTIIGSNNGLSPGRRQAIILTNDGILLIKTSGTNFNEILIEIHISSLKKRHLKISSVKCRSCCLGLNVLSVNTDNPAWL